MPNIKFTTVMAQILVIILFLVAPSSAQESGGPAQLTVSGEGVIKTAPDMATLVFGVVSRDARPDIARSKNATAAAAALNAVRALGVEEKDIQMQNMRITPLREYDQDRRTYVQNGYEATRSLAVTVRDLDLLPDLVAAIIEKGANRMNSIQYGLDDRADIELEVLRLAVAAARAKADVMASQLGMTLGSVYRLSEQGISVPRPVMRMEAAYDVSAAKAMAEPDAFAGGQIEVRAVVTAVFLIR